jgi:hypothetical protein
MPLLGGSPGASTSVLDMLRVIEECFPQQLNAWKLEQLSCLLFLWPILPPFKRRLKMSSELFN